jgi:hypothetical protein
MTRLLKNMLEGAGSIINLFPSGPEYENPLKKHKTAADAMASDWLAIGCDMQKAIDKVASEIKQTR